MALGHLFCASVLVGITGLSSTALGQAWYVEAPLPPGIIATTASASAADGTVVVGSGAIQGSPSNTAGIIARLTAPGVVQTIAYAPPAPYLSCAITTVNSDGTAFGGWVQAGSGQSRFPALFSPNTGWLVLGGFPGVNITGISEDGQLLMGQQFVNGEGKAAIFGVGVGGLLSTTTIEGKTIFTSVPEGGVLTLNGYSITGSATFTDGTSGIVQWFLAPHFAGTQILPKGLDKSIVRAPSSRDGQRLAITYVHYWPSGSPSSFNVGSVTVGGTDFTFPALGPNDAGHEVNSVTNDGSIMVGQVYGADNSTRSSVWRGTTRHDLFNLLSSAGAAVNPAQNSITLASSQTGDLFVGTVRPTEQSRRIFFASVTIPANTPDCPADFNRDGFVDFFDFDDFIGAFETGC